MEVLLKWFCLLGRPRSKKFQTYGIFSFLPRGCDSQLPRLSTVLRVLPIPNSSAVEYCLGILSKSELPTRVAPASGFFRTVDVELPSSASARRKQSSELTKPSDVIIKG